MPASPASPASPPAAASTRDYIIGEAKNLPDLVAAARVYDPALAQSLEGKALLASKSTYGGAAALAVSWAVTKWGLGWSPDMCALAAGMIVLLVNAALRALTRSPITGFANVGQQAPQTEGEGK